MSQEGRMKKKDEKIAGDAEKEGRWKVCGQREERCNEKKKHSSDDEEKEGRWKERADEKEGWKTRNSTHFQKHANLADTASAAHDESEHTDGQARRLRCVHRRPGEGRRRRCSMDVRASIRGVYERVLTGVADILFLFYFLCMQLARVLTDIVKAPADVLFF